MFMSSDKPEAVGFSIALNGYGAEFVPESVLSDFAFGDEIIAVKLQIFELSSV